MTRFCIICNYISRLIPPIASRCAKFRFKPLPHEAMVERLSFIATSEGVDCPKETLAELTTQSEGDMRRAIQMLQSVHQLYGGQLAPQGVLDISGALPQAMITKTLETCKRNDFDAMQAFVEEVIAEGFPAQQLCAQLLDRLLVDTSLSCACKSKIAMEIASVDKSLVDGADEYLQLTNLLATAMRGMAARA